MTGSRFGSTEGFTGEDVVEERSCTTSTGGRAVNAKYPGFGTLITDLVPRRETGIA